MGSLTFEALRRRRLTSHLLHVLDLCWQAAVLHLHDYCLNIVVGAETPLTEMRFPSCRLHVTYLHVLIFEGVLVPMLARRPLIEVCHCVIESPVRLQLTAVIQAKVSAMVVSQSPVEHLGILVHQGQIKVETSLSDCGCFRLYLSSSDFYLFWQQGLHSIIQIWPLPHIVVYVACLVKRHVCGEKIVAF